MYIYGVHSVKLMKDSVVETDQPGLWVKSLSQRDVNGSKCLGSECLGISKPQFSHLNSSKSQPNYALIPTHTSMPAFCGLHWGQV